MVCSNGTIESLVVLYEALLVADHGTVGKGSRTVHNRLQCPLNLMVHVQKLRFTICFAQSTCVHQIQGNVHGDTLGIAHEIPVSLNRLQNRYRN